MSSLHILILYTILTIIIAENRTLYFTQSTYDIWCQENVLSSSLFLYPNQIPVGIPRTSNIKSVIYHLIDDDNNGLFAVKTKRLVDFYFFILNITRPLDINREYQDIYLLHIQADIITNQENVTEQAKIYLHIADSNDNDGVFDMDIYEKTFSEPLKTPQLLIRFHASDADEIHHAQILYELSSSSFNETFSLHPFTGELYLISKANLQLIYEFDIYAYDRYRKDLINNNNIKTKAHVKLIFPQNETFYRLTTIWNQTIEFKEMISSYKILVFQNSNWNLHQAILTIEISSIGLSFEIFILNNSSLNSIHLFLYQNQIYLNQLSFEQYHLHFLICFSNRTKCQYTNYDLIPSIDFNLFQFHFKLIQTIFIEENLPIDSFLTNIRLEYNDTISNEQLIINYQLLNNQIGFNLHPKTGILRLANHLKYEKYLLDIQADIYLVNKSYSIKTNIEINIREINKYRPVFSNNTLRELFRLPYQFQAMDFDQNKQTNGRITYRLWNCFNNCSFEMNPNNGILSLRRKENFIEKKIYYLQIIAFDWGQPISFETKIDIRIHLSTRLIQRDLARRKKKSILSLAKLKESTYSPTHAETVYLNIGFKKNSTSYYLSEDTEINTIIDRLKIEYDSFPLFINNDKDNLFFYIINDTSVPFIIDQNEKLIKLINPLDREKQDQYTFEIELKLKSTYGIKLQEIYNSPMENLSFNFQYSNKYYQKMIITIYINDINDNIPKCNYFHKHIYLNENQIQTNIFQVQAFDPDLGENGTILYSLLDYHQYFTINSYTGQISSIQSIDHEQISYLRLHIIASDQGQQPQLQSLCMTLHITILDINDNIPRFSLANYIYHIFSDLPRHTIFSQIYAIDADLTDNLIYSIDSNPYITINKHTGYLRLKHHLHHLINQNLNITVKVSDGLHINQTWIYIHVKRFIEAQEPILLSEPAYSIIINQSLAIGTIITNVYHRLELLESSIDFVELINEENTIPFSIDQQGSIRLIHPLTDLSNSSYWISIRLTRYRAHPPHSFVHIHISIREDNFYLPKCVNIYQNLKLYDNSIEARVQAVSLYDHIHLQYSIIINEKLFSIDKQTGSIQLLPSIQLNHLTKSDYLLTIRALDNEHELFVDCYLKINPIQRNQLIPKFFYSSIYHINFISNNKRLRQRLFQVIALLDHKIYNKNLQIRYRILDSNQYFIINHQTGYIATKKPLYPYTTYRFNVEAFTVAFRGKWRIVSSRSILSIKVQILPMNTLDSSLLLMNESIINIDLLITTKVGSILLQLGKNQNYTQWFIMIGQIEHTQYFHVNFQSGELILIRPIEELANKTTIIELRINVTNDWIHMNTIKIIIHIKNDKFSFSHFSQTDYYSSVSKTIPIGIEIARLTIENSIDNCTYHIHSVERIKSKNFFHINPSSGSITILQSLEKSNNDKHLLTIIYYCQYPSHIASTRLHINILDKKISKNQFNNSYRFSQENYLIIFETSLINQQRKHLINLELINNDDQRNRIKPDAQIIQGDPLGLFAIDSSNQSLFLLDESRSRSYIYPIHLTVIDTSQREPINCTITLFISNIAIQFTCPLHLNTSPYLFTYESIPANSIDPLTGQQYNHYNSLTIRGFDSFTPSNLATCVIRNSEIELSNKKIDFMFEKDHYHGYINSSLYNNQELFHLSIKNRDNYPDPFDITYQFINQSNLNSFQLDEYTGIIKYISKKTFFNHYSFLILAKYQSLMTFTRLNIVFNHPKQSIYEFQLFKPFVNNYTIGYLNEKTSNWKFFDRKISSMFSIDNQGRLFIKNQTVILTGGNFYDFIIGKIRIQISILSKEIIQCSLNRFNFPQENQLIGFINIINPRKRSFYLLNYNHLFKLDHQHGLLYHQNQNQIIENDLVLLIEIGNARCLITIDGVSSIPYMMIRKGDDLEMEIDKVIDVKKSPGRIELQNGTLINFDIISNQAPIFSQKSYTFSLDLTNNINKKMFIGQISAQPYSTHRSHLVYQFLSSTKHFIINPDNGIIEYLPNKYYNKTKEQLQIIARDLIYQQNTTINIIIHILKPEFISLSSLVYHQTISEVLSPGSIVFQPNISSAQNLQYSLQDNHSNLFTIDSNTGQVTLLNYLSDLFYSIKIHISPINQILIIQLTILDDNNHSPIFVNLPLNLTISSDDTFVTKLTAYDLDLSDNENLKYYLPDKDQQKIFSIDQKSGIITLKTPSNQTFFPLKIAVSDGLYLTTNSLPITIYNYSKNSPKFSSNEYLFQYNQTLGRISAYDSDPNDQIIYQLYLEPDGIKVDQYSGLITINKNFFPQTIEFFASASDRAEQIVYTKIQIIFPIQPKFYEFFIEKIHLKENYFIQKFDLKNSLLKIHSTSLTTNDCIENFYLKSNELYFKNYPILSDLCFFELQLSNDKNISTNQIKILFINSDLIPKFSSNIYHFYTNHIRVFAKSLNTIRYKLQTNPYGLIINRTNGVLLFKYSSDRLGKLDRIQLVVYAIDEKTNLNDTALINIILKKQKQFEIPTEVSLCPNIPTAISDQSLPGTIIQDIHLQNNNANHYYILSGDKYGLFGINNLVKLYLVSSILNRTSDEYFELIILISSFSISYCRTNISINRSHKWSYFICPPMPIEWMIEEKSPIGTRVGNIKEILSMINNNSQLIERLQMKLNTNNDTQAFYFNSSTGLITSNSRLDYEQKTFYSFSISLEPNELNCSLLILIKLININDNSIVLDQKSLIYTINENNLIPFYIGRIRLVDPDQLFSFECKYYLKNSSSDISIDSTTGSIILLTKLNREFHGEKLQYEIIVIDYLNQKNFTDILIININHLINYGPLFEKDIYQINISKSLQPGTVIFQIIASSYDATRNGNISYYLRNSSSIFSIEKYSGNIRLNKFIPSIRNNYTLIIEAIEDGEINLTDRTYVFISTINDDYMYFNFENIHQCFIDENKLNGTKICTIGKNSIDFIYHLIDSRNLFDILANNGTIINRKIFNYEIDQHEYNVTIVVRDRKNQSTLLSSLNLTIYLRNLNDQPSEFLRENFTTLLYLVYPSVNTILYKIEGINKDQSNFMYEIVNDTFSTYTLRISSNLTELILIKSIIHNREDNLILRLWNNKNVSSDLNLRLIYHQYEIKLPILLSQTIDGYIHPEENSLSINLGQLSIQNHSQYQFIYFDLIPNKHFFLKQLSNNHTELYFKSFHQSSFLTVPIYLTVIALTEPIPKMDFSNNIKVFSSSMLKSQSIDIHLWPINHEMLDRTISLLININSNITYEQFLTHNFPLIRQTLAQIIGVHTHHVHIYTFNFQQNQIELLVAILRSTSNHYIHKKFLYNTVKNSTNIFNKILLNQCQLNSCENNAYCTSYISLLYNQYKYFYSNTYQHLVPKYQWNTKCLCANSYSGQRCQFKQDKQSPCLSNPCLSTEKCIEQNSTLYSCQCIDNLCSIKNSFRCININSPTCRDPSNTLTFDGYSFIRMNLTVNTTQYLNLKLSFRTQSTEGKLLKLVYFTEKTKIYDSIIIQIIDGYIKLELNENILLQLDDILINDGLWHDISFSIDYSHSYYLLRLDHVFSEKIILSKQIYSTNLIQLIIGTNFHGCLGNLTLNKQNIFLQHEKENNFIGTNKGCQLSEIINDDLCSLYHPCYHGGICINTELSFTCNCSKSRFTGRQCQLDLSPCESSPCQFNEQCIPSSIDLNKSFTCIPISISRKKTLYIGLIIPFSLCILVILVISYRKKRKENFLKDKPIVSSPLFIHKSSSITNQIDSQMQTLLKSDYNRKQTIDNHLSYESLNRRLNDSKYYSNIEPMNNLIHYSSINNTNIPQTTDLFDFSSSPTQYFNNQNSDNRRNYQIYVNSLSNLTDNFLEQTDIDFTESSNNSSITNRNHKRSFHFNHNKISVSTLSLPKAPIYARIVKTSKMTNTIEHHRLNNPLTTSTPTSFIKPIENESDETNILRINRLRHASDSDLLAGHKSIKLSSFFQTDV